MRQHHSTTMGMTRKPLNTNRKIVCLGTLILTFMLSGCSYFLSMDYRNYQNVTIKTRPSGATCTLYNNHGIWRVVNGTPHRFKVRRSREPLQVICQKRGYIAVTNLIRAKLMRMPMGHLVPVNHPVTADHYFKYPQLIKLELPPIPASKRRPKNYSRAYNPKAAKN